MQRTDRKSISTHGGPTNHHTSYSTYKMGLINYISAQITWNTMHMLRSQRFKQSNHKRTLQGTNTCGNFTQTSRSNHIFQIRCQRWVWSVHLDTASSYLTTFNTHNGRYRFLCMPFGLKMSQDMFQMRMDQTTDRLPGVIAIHDDICIYGKTKNNMINISYNYLRQHQKMDWYSTVENVTSANHKSPSTEQSSQHKV